jgi:hypothetical protein
MPRKRMSKSKRCDNSVSLTVLDNAIHCMRATETIDALHYSYLSLTVLDNAIHCMRATETIDALHYAYFCSISFLLQENGGIHKHFLALFNEYTKILTLHLSKQS